MSFLFAFTAVLVIGLTAEHKRPDPAARRLSGIIVRSRQWRKEESWLSLVSIIAGVHTKQSKEVKNMPWAESFSVRLSNTETSKAVKVNVPIVTRTRYAVIAQRNHFLSKDKTIKTL
jgi:hypothetical protein